MKLIKTNRGRHGQRSPSPHPCMGLSESSTNLSSSTSFFLSAHPFARPVRSFLGSIERGANIGATGRQQCYLRSLVAHGALHHRQSGARTRRSEASLPSGDDLRATTLYSVDPCGIRTMMQSCASAARLRGAGPFSPAAWKAMGGGGSPPPRIILASHRAEADERRTCIFAPMLFRPIRSYGRSHDGAGRYLACCHVSP
jgi:hypothetical protein